MAASTEIMPLLGLGTRRTSDGDRHGPGFDASELFTGARTLAKCPEWVESEHSGGFTSQRVPLQIAGPKFAKGRILALARAYQDRTAWDEATPTFAPTLG